MDFLPKRCKNSPSFATQSNLLPENATLPISKKNRIEETTDAIAQRICNQAWNSFCQQSLLIEGMSSTCQKTAASCLFSISPEDREDFVTQAHLLTQGISAQSKPELLFCLASLAKRERAVFVTEAIHLLEGIPLSTHERTKLLSCLALFHGTERQSFVTHALRLSEGISAESKSRVIYLLSNTLVSMVWEPFVEKALRLTEGMNSTSKLEWIESFLSGSLDL